MTKRTTTLWSLRQLIPSVKAIQILAVFAAIFIWQSTNTVIAQVTKTPKESTEPVDPIREKQKEAYFAKLKENEKNPISTANVPDEFSGEPLPNWNDTGDFEADKATYLAAVEGWLKRNAHLYNDEDLGFLRNPVLKVEERQRTLNNN